MEHGGMEGVVKVARPSLARSVLRCVLPAFHSFIPPFGISDARATNGYDGNVPGDYNKRDPERENWPCRVMLPILPIPSISGSRLL